MASTTNDVDSEIAFELLPFLRVYKDGRVERLLGSPIVPPSPQGDPQTGVFSKDITISPTISARLYLPITTTTTTTQKLPLLLYFHGGAFCIESAFSFLYHRYLSLLSSHATVLIVSLEYRLAPEHLLPAAYNDSWDALQWVLSHSLQDHHHPEQERWLLDHGDFDRVFMGGDSAGGNIAHNVTIRAGFNGLSSRIRGVLLANAAFWGSARIGSEEEKPADAELMSRLWPFVSGGAGLDDPWINPLGDGAPSLAGLGCSKLLVCVAGEDLFKDREKLYYEEVKKSGWDGEVELFEVAGEDHCFHINDPESENSKLMMGRLASFLNQ